MQKRQILLFVLGLFLLIGCAATEPIPPTNTPRPTKTPKPPDTPVPPVAVGDAERGKVIFENGGSMDGAEQHRCARCHSVDGSGEMNHNGPELLGISEIAGERVSELSAAQYLHQSVMDPRAYVVEGYPFMSLTTRHFITEEELSDVIAYLLTK